MPTYNVVRFVEEAVNSILKQTYVNFEFIIVDDFSTDGTYEKLLELASKDFRIKLFRNEMNSGIVETLNFALSKSKGEYIVRMDGDDLCSPLKLEKQLEFLLNNEDISLVGCDVICIDENDAVLNNVITSHTVKCTKKILSYVSPVLHIWMCKKEIYMILNGYRQLGGSEDYDFLLRMDSLGYKFLNIPFFGYSVRLRSGNTQTTKGLYQRKIVYYIRRLYKERLVKNFDSFNLADRDKITKSNPILEKIHKLSINFTYKAIQSRGEKKYVLFLFYLLFSLVSPYQIQYYFENFLVKMYLKKYN
ncbi:glycosyltransferase EpsE [Flavobacterium chilense]|uniref:Glycosyltransferase EpsE n=2 Tax=Flavobacterium chilense TaxID=946677 RepID=A0A1M7GTE1_9FLAO|nr:glycosyltransferase EpsE [Flavobacterium chilense]